jgi:hypothetical protein
MRRLVTLTEPQRAALVARFRAEKNVHLRDRLHCVLLKADGRTNWETAAILLTSSTPSMTGSAATTPAGWRPSASGKSAAPTPV